MSIVSFSDSTFRKENSNKYEISIQLSLNGFSYLISNVAEGNYAEFFFEPLPKDIVFEDFFEKAARFLKKDIFNNTFDSIKIYNTSLKSILIPEAVFELERIKDIYSLTYRLEEDEMLFYNKLLNYYLVYPLPSYISSLVANKFGKTQIYHNVFPLLQSFMQQVKNSLEDVVWVYLENGYFTIIVYKKSELQLYNTFKYKNVNDYIFFLMNIFEQLKLNTINTELYLIGQVTKESAYYLSACTFVKNVYMLSPDDAFYRKSDGLIDRYYYHQHANIFLI